MDAAMRRLAQQAEARSVIVEAGEDDQQRRDDQRCGAANRPEAHLRIELLLQNARAVEVGDGHQSALVGGGQSAHENGAGVASSRPREMRTTLPT